MNHSGGGLKVSLTRLPFGKVITATGADATTCSGGRFTTSHVGLIALISIYIYQQFKHTKAHYS